MRELNFSIPSGNKACVSINQNLYDRRALDTTSTLPLINSLNHLTYLTTSSARIRDILTVDGGIERLIAMLKDGRCSKDASENWKWNLCFQCVVNIGVRGSENVRTRVVEADVVPVVATLLDNYIKIVDKCREKVDQELHKTTKHHHKHHKSESSRHTSRRARNGPPPPIDIQATQQDLEDEAPTPIPAQALSSPPERTTFGHRHQHSLDETGRIPTAVSLPLIVTTQEGLRPVRDIDRLPSMFPTLQAGFAPPDSPTTPNGVLGLHNAGIRGSPLRGVGGGRRPSIRHQLSISNQSDIIPSDEPSIDDVSTDTNLNTTTDLDALDSEDIQMQDMDDATVLQDAGSPVRLEPTTTSIEVQGPLDLARIESELDVVESVGVVGQPGMLNGAVPLASQMTLNAYHRYFHERSLANGGITSMPRDEDIIMSLQLLAYVSKYCTLRSYFHKTHLVPRLKTTAYELALLDLEPGSLAQISLSTPNDPSTLELNLPPLPSEEDLEEYTQPDDFSIFPLVEKFTVRHHAPEMQYWARVVMRNLCRRDDSQGGIRQCAYYQCGKWENYIREFAKCRRCRRTKYCSKECQKSAWVYHRHWCVEAGGGGGREGSG
jgi:hypothetical protein